jgi:hypothetical protein
VPPGHPRTFFASPGYRISSLYVSTVRVRSAKPRVCFAVYPYRSAYTRLKFRTLTAFFAHYIIAVSIIIPNFEYSNQSPMDKETISQYASELSELVQSFINDYEHPEDGILIIKLDNIDEKKVVYIEDTLKPPYDEEDWAEYPLLDLMQDADAPNEKWEINPDGVLEVATDILDI